MNATERSETSELLDIDRNVLDKEWLDQPKHMWRYGTMLADAWNVLRTAKTNAEVQWAELKRLAAKIDLDIRKNPANYKIDKITETVVANAVLVDPKYTRKQERCFEADREVNQAYHDVDILKAAVEALQDKKASMENNVRLYGMQFWSEPKATGDNKSMVDDMRMRRTVKNRRSK